MRILPKLELIFLSVCLAVILIFSLVSYFQNRQTHLKHFYESSEKEILHFEKVIDTFFEEAKANVLFLEDRLGEAPIDDNLFSLVGLTGEGKVFPAYTSETDEKLLSLFDSFLKTHPNITMVYFGSASGGYIEVPIVELGKGYDPRVRPWFQKALQNPNRVTITGVYRTLFSEVSQLGIVKAVTRAGELSGVIGLSVSLKALTDMIQQAKIQEIGHVFLIDSAGTILANSLDPQYNFGPLSSVSPDLSDPQLFQREAALYVNGKKTLSVSAENYSLQWRYLILADENELFESLQLYTFYLAAFALAIMVSVLLLTIPVSRGFSHPIEEFSRQMNRFGKQHFFEKINIKGFREIEEMSDSFNAMTEELKALLDKNKVYNDELERINETLKNQNLELEESSERLSEYSSKVEEMIWITSRMCSSAMEKDENFLKDLLEMIMGLVPKADYGSVSLVEGERWRFVHTVGHDIEILKQLPLTSDLLQELQNAKLVDHLMETNERIFPPDLYEPFWRATKPVRSSILSRLKFSGQTLGTLSIDIAAESEEQFSSEDQKIVQTFSNVASAFLTMQKYIQQQENFQKDLITSMIRLLEIHDPYTKGHSENVAKISVNIAEAIGLDKSQISRVFWSGLVHDIGKVLVPGAILSKPSMLTAKEYNLIKDHPVWGARVLETFEDLQDVARYVRFHHERWDGLGYPEGIEGEDIPLISRILSVADALEAMTSDRPYREKISLAEALKEIEKNAGTQFDPKIAQMAVKSIKRLS